jgi:ATP-binding cassette subfamily C (CFTR/MRP) protein 1
LADWLVVLGDASVKYQGTWADLTLKPEHILTVHVTETSKSNAKDQIQMDSTVQSQTLKVADAISDLTRATGDVSLYGNMLIQSYGCFVLTSLSYVGYYVKSVGYRNFLLLLACTASYSFFVTFPQYWLNKWTAAPPSQTMFYIGGYLISSLLAWASTNGSMW